MPVSFGLGPNYTKLTSSVKMLGLNKGIHSLGKVRISL